MYYLILTLLIIDALLLATVILLQAGQGGGLASLGGGTTDTVMGGRQAVTLLTRATWWCGGIFLGLALLLSVMSANRGTSFESNIQEQIRQQSAPAPAATQEAAPSTLPIEGLTPAAPATDSAGGGTQ